MLSEANAVATIAVKNLETARKFYHDMVGLKEVRSRMSRLSWKWSDPPLR